MIVQMVDLLLEGGEIDSTCSGIRPAIVSALRNKSSIDIFSYFKKRTLDINPSSQTYGCTLVKMLKMLNHP